MEASILQIGVHCAQWVENISEMNVAIYLDIMVEQVSVVMWLAPRPSVRESRVQIP